MPSEQEKCTCKYCQADARKAALRAIATAAGVPADAEPDKIVEAVCKRLKEFQYAHWYWREGEHSVESIDEAVEDEEPGAIVELRPVHELPSVWVLVTEEGAKEFATREAAEQAKAGGAITGFGADPDLKPGPLTPEDRGWRPT